MRNALSIFVTVLLAAGLLAGFAYGVTVLNDVISEPSQAPFGPCEGAPAPVGDC